MDLDIDSFENRVQIGRYLRVPEPNNAISLLFEPSLSLDVALRLVITVVMPAIELNDEAPRWTKEVNDIWADRRLSSEVGAFERNLLECPPQDALVRRGIGSQFFAAARRIDVETVCAASPHPGSHFASLHASRPSPSRGG
jgi:hypothetical protein